MLIAVNSHTMDDRTNLHVSHYSPLQLCLCFFSVVFMSFLIVFVFVLM